MLTDLVLRPMADAFLQVGVFVAVLVGLGAWLRVRHGSRLIDSLERHRRQGPVLGAVLGVTPGCGGAIVILPLYLKGRVSYGTVVAAVTATMGDSSWVIMAGAPLVALKLHLILLVTGLVAGYAVDVAAIDPRARTRRSRKSQEAVTQPAATASSSAAALPHAARSLPTQQASSQGGAVALAPPAVPWALAAAASAMWLLTGAGSLLAIPAAFHVFDPTVWALELGHLDPWLLLGVTGTSVCLVVFLVSGRRFGDDDEESPHDMHSALSHGAVETAFVVVWVSVALVLTQALAALPWAAGLTLPFDGLSGIALAALVGLVPGCGVQIAFTGLYLSGAAPFSVLLTNAVAQDGDALFPLLALDRRAAVVTSGLTTVPALIAGVVAYLLL